MSRFLAVPLWCLGGIGLFMAATPYTPLALNLLPAIALCFFIAGRCSKDRK